MKKLKKILVTCALPYSNGSIHLGHILEHIQADIWVRYQRMRGYEVYFICADDAHGTPIMIKAKNMGLDPEKIIVAMNKEHKLDFLNFNIIHDNYYSTHSDENFKLLLYIYKKLKNNGLIFKKTISQLYDIEKNMFLPDRFIRGICPRCKEKNQYGDNCDVCGATYNPEELIQPRSVLSGSVPILKNSNHLFFNLPNFTDMLKAWIQSGVLQTSIVNKVFEWFKIGLQPWNISRDTPYFGFKIPHVLNKYFYVWMDASIGYMSCFKNLCDKNNRINFNDFWSKNSKEKIYHFIGKDIVYFHSLFWPAILEGSGFRKPTKIFVHGHLTLNGKKMSKSKGNFIKASTWLKYLDSDSLRYYFATKLSSSIEDIDLNLTEYLNKVNSDIVNKIVNLGARNASFIQKFFFGKLSKNLENPELYKNFVEASYSISEKFYKRNFSSLIREIIRFTDLANSYIDEKAPWNIQIKNKIQNICSMGINLFRVIMTWLKPIVPSLALKVEKFLKIELHWDGIHYPLLNHKIEKFKMLYNRIQKEQIFSLINKSQSSEKKV